MGLATQIKQLYTYMLGGTNPPGAASASGDMSQMLKWLEDWRSIQIPTVAAFPGFMGPGGIWSASQGAGTGPLVYAGLTNGFAATGSPTITWDNTAKLWTFGNTTGSISGYGGNSTQGQPLVPRLHSWKSGAANQNNMRLPTGGLSVLVMEWYGKWNNAGTTSADRGIGVSTVQTGANMFSTNRNVGFYRKTTSGWTVESADGTTQSDTSEASDTSDGNYHWFRMEWDDAAGNAKLYVDGVLKVTKTTNLPAMGTTGMPLYNTAQAAAGDPTKMFELACGLLYWK